MSLRWQNLLRTAALTAMLLSPSACLAQQDEESYCAGGPSRFVVFLVDRSDALTAEDRREFVEGAVNVLNRAPGRHFLVIHKMSDKPGALERPLKACIPGCPENLSMLESLTSSCTQPAVDRDRYLVGLRTAQILLQLAQDPEKSSKSRIVETLNILTRQYAGQISSIYIFSDMIENSEVVGSFYGLKSEKIESLLEKLKKKELIPSLKNVPVVAYGVGRKQNGKELTNDQYRVLENFWPRFFQAAGTKIDMKRQLD